MDKKLVKYRSDTAPVTTPRARQWFTEAAKDGIPFLVLVHDTVKNHDVMVNPSGNTLDVLLQSINRTKRFKVLVVLDTTQPFETQWGAEL